MKTRQTNNELNEKEKGENARDKYQVRALLSFPSNEGGERKRKRGRERGRKRESRLLGSA